MQVDIHEANTRLSHLINLVEAGESVLIARDGKPVAELIPARNRVGLPVGIAIGEALVSPGDDWWAPLTDGEAEGWAGGT